MSSRSSRRKLELIDWTQRKLVPGDYAFAASSERERWLSPTHTWFSLKVKNKVRPKNSGAWPHRLLVECLSWELRRETLDHDLSPFTVAQEQRIKEALEYRPPTPADLPPLNEIAAFEPAIRAIVNQPRLPESTFHVLEIEVCEDTDVVVQRFRNWLTRKRSTRTVPKSRSRPEVKLTGRGFALVNGEVVQTIEEPGGRDDPGATLRAIAVRRLKLAGFKRPAASVALRMKDHVLSSDDWEKLPKRAEEEVTEQLANLRDLDRCGLLD